MNFTYLSLLYTPKILSYLHQSEVLQWLTQKLILLTKSDKKGTTIYLYQFLDTIFRYNAQYALLTLMQFTQTRWDYDNYTILKGTELGIIVKLHKNPRQQE